MLRGQFGLSSAGLHAVVLTVGMFRSVFTGVSKSQMITVDDCLHPLITGDGHAPLESPETNRV